MVPLARASSPTTETRPAAWWRAPSSLQTSAGARSLGHLLIAHPCLAALIWRSLQGLGLAHLLGAGICLLWRLHDGGPFQSWHVCDKLMGCRDHDYHNFLFSMKASNPLVMVQAYRLLSEEMYLKGWDYPLHLGVTEVGNRTMHDKGRGSGSESVDYLLVSGQSELILMHPGLLSATAGMGNVHLWSSHRSKRLSQLVCLHLHHSKRRFSQAVHG